MVDIMDSSMEGRKALKRMSNYPKWSINRLRNAILQGEKAMCAVGIGLRYILIEKRVVDIQRELFERRTG